MKTMHRYGDHSWFRKFRIQEWKPFLHQKLLEFGHVRITSYLFTSLRFTTWSNQGLLKQPVDNFTIHDRISGNNIFQPPVDMLKIDLTHPGAAQCATATPHFSQLQGRGGTRTRIPVAASKQGLGKQKTDEINPSFLELWGYLTHRMETCLDTVNYHILILYTVDLVNICLVVSNWN